MIGKGLIDGHYLDNKYYGSIRNQEGDYRISQNCKSV